MPPLASNKINTASDDEASLGASHNEIKMSDTKNVSFCGCVKVVEIPRRSIFTSGQKASMWYSREELKQLKSQSDISVTSPCDTRHGHDESDKLHRRLITQAIKVVLYEQQLQRDECDEDPELIADNYYSCTFKNQREALERGRHHAQIVKEQWWYDHPLYRSGTYNLSTYLSNCSNHNVFTLR